MDTEVVQTNILAADGAPKSKLKKSLYVFDVSYIRDSLQEFSGNANIIKGQCPLVSVCHVTSSWSLMTIFISVNTIQAKKTCSDV